VQLIVSGGEAVCLIENGRMGRVPRLSQKACEGH